MGFLILIYQASLGYHGHHAHIRWASLSMTINLRLCYILYRHPMSCTFRPNPSPLLRPVRLSATKYGSLYEVYKPIDPSSLHIFPSLYTPKANLYAILASPFSPVPARACHANSAPCRLADILIFTLHVLVPSRFSSFYRPDFDSESPLDTHTLVYVKPSIHLFISYLFNLKLGL